MTTTTHTHAPWHIGGKSGHIIYAADGYAIANTETYHGRHTAEQIDGNTSLIAAAPDMLKALEELVDAVDRNAVRQEDWPELRSAYAAIRAARGEG